jgi:DNA-binding PadR family transcriptional regulator
MIDVAILGVLAEHELHGYELSKRLGDVLEPGASVSFGSIYPALGRLERAGLVKAVEAGRTQAVPMTGSLAGELAAARSRPPSLRGRRAKKVYGITHRGEQRLVELLVDPAGLGTSAGFGLRLALFRYLGARQRAEVVEHRRRALRQLGTELDRLAEPTDRWLAARRQREQALIDEELHWLDGLAELEHAEPHDGAEGAPTTPTTGTAPAAPDTPLGGME